MLSKLVSINSVIVDLIDDLDLDHTKNRAKFINWAIKAEKEISSPRQYVRKIAVLQIKNCYAELPCDAAIVDLALLGDYGCECGDLFERVRLGTVNVTSGNVESTTFLIVDLPHEVTTGSSTFNINPVTISIQDNKLIFSKNLDGQKVTIQYRGIVLDSEGFPMVLENHVNAIIEYCMYKLKRSTARSGLDMGMYRDHKIEWERLAAAARGDDAMPSESERQKISNTLNNPLAGKSL